MTNGPATSSLVQLLLSDVVDYAGLFPPAALPMTEAVAHYAAERRGPDAWMLGRFVLPASRLDECRQALAAQPTPDAAWPLSVVAGGDLDVDVAIVERFSAPGAAVVSLEMKAHAPEDVDAVAARVPAHVDTFVEVPLGDGLPALVARLAARGLKAKIRTGGTTPDAFPTPEAVVGFLGAVVQARVPFKATAGLHHPIGGAFPLTYAPDAPLGTMYGYLNVLLSTGATRAGWCAASVQALLCERDPAAFRFEGRGVRWRDSHLDGPLLEQTRRQHFLSFGSCSFREPVDEGRVLTTSHA